MLMYPYRRNTMTSACVIALVCIVLQRCTITSGSTHWIVTEDGKVQSQADSVFNLRRPYDLVAFLKQEDRATMLNDLKKELLSRKDEIDRNEDRDTGLEQKFYKTNPDCIEAGKRLPEFDLYISTVLPLENKGIRPEEHIDINAAPNSNPKAPDCSDFMDLDFSMHAFEHLEGIKSRSNLSGTAELGLKNAITHRENVDDYGHLVYEALHKNKTSWVLYNMAAFYWRIKGNTHQAVECIRRALHLSPRLQKDVALISLANILHRARFCNEAAILVHSALEVSKELNVNHFTLGNIYAVLGEYNKSIICFENTLKIQPDFEAAAKRRHAVLCHSKLEQALEAQHRSLQRTLQDLKDYQRKHDLYQTQSDKLLSEQIPHEMKIAQHIAYEQQRMREQMAEKVGHCAGGKGGKSFSSEQEDILFSGDFTSRLEDVSDHYEKKGVCHGDECGHLRVQQSPIQQTVGPKPHTKLEYVEGVLRHKLIFLQVLPSEMEVNEDECVIFNDGTKSPGCSREEFQSYIAELERDVQNLKKMASVHNKGNGFHLRDSPYISQGDGDAPSMKFVFRATSENVNLHDKAKESLEEGKDGGGGEGEVYGEDEEDVFFEDEDADEELHIHWLTPEEEAEYDRYFKKYSREANWGSVEEGTVTSKGGDKNGVNLVVVKDTEEATMQVNDHDLDKKATATQTETDHERQMREKREKRRKGERKKITTLEKEKKEEKEKKTVVVKASSLHPQPMIQTKPVKFDPKQTPDDQLPNTHVHLKKREMPKLGACEKQCAYEEDRFTSTWIALEKKGINEDDWMDYPEHCPRENEDPICPEGLASPVMSMDHLPGVMHRAGSKHVPEPDLHEILVNLPGKRVTTCQIKNILVENMASNSSSWVAYLMSGLYWRVQGNPRHSLDCFRVAITYAPYQYRDIPLISMANVLQQTSYNNDAIIAANAALHIQDSLNMSHFTMALLYAAKSDMDNFVLFLQAHLAHSTHPDTREMTAKQLKRIYCANVASYRVFVMPKEKRAKKGNNE